MDVTPDPPMENPNVPNDMVRAYALSLFLRILGEAIQDMPATSGPSSKAALLENLARQQEAL